MSDDLVFEFPAYASALADVIRESPANRAFVMGITGPWGSGKTTLMEEIVRNLGDAEFTSVRFNAWAHSKQETVWRALFISVLSALRLELERNDDGNPRSKLEREDLEARLDEAERALYTAFVRETPGEITLDTGNLAKSGAKLALRLVPWGDVGASLMGWLFDRGMRKAKTEDDGDEDSGLDESDIDALWGVFKRDLVRQQIVQIQSAEQFKMSLEGLLKTTLSQGRRLVVVIDDVDRCLPEQGLDVFEAIKLYLDFPGAIFIIAMDQEVLQHALDLRYHSRKGGQRVNANYYAEKMLDLTFSIPPATDDGLTEFLSGLPSQDLLARYYKLLKVALPGTPRTWNRFAARLKLHQRIIERIGETRGVNPFTNSHIEAAFVKLQLLNFRWPEVSRALGSLDALLLLETCVREAEVTGPDFRDIATQQGIEAALRTTSSNAAKLPDAVWLFLDDPVLLTLLHTEPQFGAASTDPRLLTRIFSLDLPSDTQVALPG